MPPERRILISSQACVLLQRLSRSRGVWHTILLRALNTTIPCPFLLPRPLAECAAQDLEDAFVRWHGPWRATDAPQTIESVSSRIDLNVLAGREVCIESMMMTPGGRWVLLADDRGAVYYIDLDEIPGELAPKLLIPPPMEPIRKVTVRMAIDTTSAGDAPHYHLTNFTLAVFITSSKRHACPTHVEVWRTEVGSTGPGNTKVALQPAERLSSFKDQLYKTLHSCDILGDTLAYAVAGGFDRRAIIVDWKESNGKDPDELQRSCIERLTPNVGKEPIFLEQFNLTLLSSFQHLLLLPHARIIGRFEQGDWLCLHDYPPPHAPAPQPSHRPLWEDSELGRFPTRPHLFRMGEELRLVVGQSRDSTRSLIIPVDPTKANYHAKWEDCDENDTWDSEGVQRLPALALGYRKGVGLYYYCQKWEVYLSHFGWGRDGGETGKSGVRGKTNIARVSGMDARREGERLIVFFDEFSHRVVVFERKMDRYISLNL